MEEALRCGGGVRLKTEAFEVVEIAHLIGEEFEDHAPKLKDIAGEGLLPTQYGLWGMTAWVAEGVWKKQARCKSRGWIGGDDMPESTDLPALGRILQRLRKS